MKTGRVFMILFVSLLCTASLSYAADLSKTMRDMQSKIEQKAEELNSYRARAAKERIELNTSIRELQAHVGELRKEDKILQSFLMEKDLGFERIKEKSSRLSDELRFIYTQLSDYRRNMIKRMSLAQELDLQPQFDNLDKNFNPAVPSGMTQALPPLLTLIEKHITDVQKGFIFQGEALNSSGKLYKGRFLSLGPIEYFLSDDKSLGGIVGMSYAQLRPEVIYPVNTSLLDKVFAGTEQLLPLDVTGGDAVKIEQQQTKTFLQELKGGGVVMWPIIGLSVICLVVMIFKFFSLIQLNVKGGFELGRIIVLINQSKVREAESLVEKLKRPLAPVLMEGIEHRSAPKEHIEEIMHERILSQVPFLEKGLSILAVGAAASPLLGLLGTVMGMMHTFDLVALFGTGKANLLSAGISEALITTKFGLIVAIPSLVAHAYFARRVKVVIHAMEQTTLAFINGLKIQNGKV